MHTARFATIVEYHRLEREYDFPTDEDLQDADDLAAYDFALGEN